ncbi:MAG: zinc-binding dehydrogenase [Planctomycetota bacterium]
MRAVVIREHGGYEQLRIEDRPRPEPGPGEVRVRVATAGLNHLDTWVRRGVEGHTFPLPLVPGCDGAGTVDALGAGAEGLEPGQRVVLAPGYVRGPDAFTARGRDHLSPTYGIFGEMRDGTCAEHVIAPRENVLPLPEHVSFEVAAAFPLAYLTAWTMLVRRARLEAGESVLVHAAGSGVSTAAVQIARLVGASKVFVTTTRPWKAKRAKTLGVDGVADTTDPAWPRAVKRLAGGGVDVVIDHVGEATFGGSLRCLAKGGRLVTCGATTGPKADVNLNLVFFKSLSILGSTMGSRGDVFRCLDLVAAGFLEPVIDDVLVLEEVAEAHRRIEAHEVFGKLVLRVGT